MSAAGALALVRGAGLVLTPRDGQICILRGSRTVVQRWAPLIEEHAEKIHALLEGEILYSDLEPDDRHCDGCNAGDRTVLIESESGLFCRECRQA